MPKQLKLFDFGDEPELGGLAQKPEPLPKSSSSAVVQTVPKKKPIRSQNWKGSPSGWSARKYD